MNWFPIECLWHEVRSRLNLPFLLSALYHAFLPALTLIFVSLGGWMLSMRNTMISTLGSDYITFANAKGIPSRSIMLRYAARNAILPNLTGFGMALGFVLSGALLTEMIFLPRPGFSTFFTGSKISGLSTYARNFHDDYNCGTWSKLACRHCYFIF